jgi:hypothetical protein
MATAACYPCREKINLVVHVISARNQRYNISGYLKVNFSAMVNNFRRAAVGGGKIFYYQEFSTFDTLLPLNLRVSFHLQVDDGAPAAIIPTLAAL